MNYKVFYTKCKRYRISAKEEFLKVCPNPEDFTGDDLNEKYGVFGYLHHPSEPAVINFVRNVYEYWQDGKSLRQHNKEQMLLLDSRNRFYSKLDRLLDEGENTGSSIADLIKDMVMDDPDETIKKYL